MERISDQKRKASTFRSKVKSRATMEPNLQQIGKQKSTREVPNKPTTKTPQTIKMAVQN